MLGLIVGFGYECQYLAKILSNKCLNLKIYAPLCLYFQYFPHNSLLGYFEAILTSTFLSFKVSIFAPHQ